MSTILDEIVTSKREQLESQKSAMPLKSFRDQLQLSDRDFARALQAPRPAFILECKKASPSRGVIRPDFDLAEIARIYGRFASAISVLTESEYFQGSMANLGIVRQHAAQPLLCKDFLVDPYQVYQARQFGADAILLILAILDDNSWKTLFDIATSLKMDVLTEISNREEQQRAIELGAPIVGINNRNLRDMSIDLQNTRTLAGALTEGTIVISESGYHSNQQVRMMGDCANGFLIGSSLMEERELEPAVKTLIFGENKVCGLTRNDDALASANAGALYGGVIFAETSARRVDFHQVESIFSGTGLKRVGVFQDHSMEQIVDIASRCQLDVIQLHGDEPPGLVAELANRLGRGTCCWKAMSVYQLQEKGDLWLSRGVDRLLVDNHSGLQRGGTGRSFDWALIPDDKRERIIVAGGIGPDNAAEAMSLGCCGVDMNSGVEESAGIKSHLKINQAFQVIREYGGSALAK